MRAANDEQKIAINHFSGGILSAGAGSGKTFVLVEHFIFIFQGFIEEHLGQGEIEFEKKLKTYLSTFALMTFTNKAASEILVRLKDRIIAEVENDKKTKSKYWESLLTNLHALNIGTIDSFCSKLIKQGIVSAAGPGIKIVSEVEHQKKIQRIIDEWLKIQLKQPKEESSFIELMLLNKSQISTALCKVFSSVQLRLQWQALKDTSLKNDTNLLNIFQDMLELESLVNVFDSKEFTSVWDEVNSLELADKNWAILFKDFHDLILKSHDLRDNEILVELENLVLDKHVKMRKPTGKKITDSIGSYYIAIKYIKDLLKDNIEGLKEFTNKSKEYIGWQSSLLELFNFIETRYEQIEGNSFADLEYYVVQSLRGEERVNAVFNYFIIDEFQDTSQTQYDFISKLVGYDTSKVFCLGDIKQAIYGFRGGEVSVYKDVLAKSENVYNLKNNYRSLKNIINFNNSFFEFILDKGHGFEGRDLFTVPMESQTCPLEDQGLGEVYKVVREIHEDLPKNQKTINEIESQDILAQIKELRTLYPDDVICVLYKNLGPSKNLITKLLNENIDFNAQIKLDFRDDPLIGIFSILLKGYYSKFIDNERDDKISKYNEVLLKTYFEIIGVKDVQPEAIKLYVGQFYSNVILFGLMESVKIFLASLGIGNKFFKNNIKTLEGYINSCNGDIHELMISLDRVMSSRFSFDYRVGDESNKVVIMTTHRSKGLEFDHVILGGIATNGIERGDHDIVGKLPGSFKWKKNAYDKKFYHSPVYLYENVLNRYKSFAESKRLLYVACTRAVKSLGWVEVIVDEKLFSYGQNSWVNALNKFEQSNISSFSNLVKIIARTENKIELSTVQPSLEYIADLGLFAKPPSLAFVMPELSVTRLASISQCSYKFYLQNICQINDEELACLGFEKAPKEVTVKSVIKSNARRGSEIHKIIEDGINRNLVTPRQCQYKDEIDWVFNLLREQSSEGVKFYPEIEMKFPINNMMISGTADLLIEGKTQEVWDFKTGALNEDENNSYWFQLICYAYAAVVTNIFDKNKKISLSLVYIDEKQTLQKEMSFLQIHEYIVNHFNKLSSLQQKNLAHCDSCIYSNICQR